MDTILMFARLLSTWILDQVDKQGGQFCCLCSEPREPNTSGLWCRDCLADLPELSLPCPTCGDRTHQDGEDCQRCLLAPPPYLSCCSAFAYDFPIRQAIHALKFRRQSAWAEALAEAAFPAFQKSFGHLDGIMIPVPLHARRLRERGFNQALFLAEGLAKRSGWQVLDKACIRNIHTEHQSRLGAEEREDNLSQAFAVIRALPDKPIVIIDDVVTTGNTALALTRQILVHHPGPVHVFSIARAQSTPPLRRAVKLASYESAAGPVSHHPVG